MTGDIRQRSIIVICLAVVLSVVSCFSYCWFAKRKRVRSDTVSEGDRAGTERLDENEHVLPGYANADQVLLNPREEVAEEKKMN